MLDPPLVTVFLIYFRNNSGEQNFFIFYESFSIRIYRPLGTIATSLPTGKPVSFLAAENYNKNKTALDYQNSLIIIRNVYKLY